MEKPKVSSNGSIALGIILIILGLMSIALPIAAIFTITFLLGMVLLLAGIMQLAFIFTSKGWGSAVMKVLIGILALIIGILLLASPLYGALTLTSLLMVFLIVGGIFGIIGAFTVRPSGEWGMMLFGGVMSLILGLLLWSQWPIKAMWVVGLFVGFVLLINGFTMLFAGISGRQK